MLLLHDPFGQGLLVFSTKHRTFATRVQKTLLMNNLIKIVFASSLILVYSCKRENPNFQAEAADPANYHQVVLTLTETIIHDIFSPPIASRNYVYSCIAGYEAARHMDESYQSLSGQITHMPAMPEPEAGQVYCFPLASITAFTHTAQKYIFSEDSIVALDKKMMKWFEDLNMPDDVRERSIAYGLAVSEAVKTWSNGDFYAQTRSNPKFTVTDDPSRWKPTPPAYMDGIEPSWNQIRTMLMDSAQQFKPLPPTAFDTVSTSQFYKEAYLVYETGKTLTNDQDEIANFWDCNPYKMNVVGHVMHASKKITPGGHWMGIAGLAARKNNSDFVHTTYAYVMTSLGLFDGFISCWDEKYRSNLIRPETYINQYIDETWVPLLQTPPFPEYTSGHSVVSGAASTILTEVFGDNFAFADSTEMMFGLPVRSYNSFIEAADEAAISRMYGGIHYMPAIENGLEEGKGVGKLILDKVDIYKK